MDALASLLDGPRARNAFLLRSVFNPPWAIRIEDRAPLTIVVVVAGRAHCWYDDETPTELGPGDVAIFRGPDPYTFADDPATAPQMIIGPDQECRTIDGAVVKPMDLFGVRSWGNSEQGATVMITGTYTMQGDVSTRLLATLPRVLTVRAHEWDAPIVALLTTEMGRDVPGQDPVLDRLLDVLLISVLRTWFARPDAEAPGWYRAAADPVVGQVLKLIHNNPEQQWTVESLAMQAGVSRAALARRFTELVGESPMAYLTDWRLSLAADLLRNPDATIGAVARKVGYGSPFALSSAFKRVRGMSPAEHRKLVS